MDITEQGTQGPPSVDRTRIEARHEGQVVATAEVTTTPEPHGTAQVGLQRHRDDAPRRSAVSWSTESWTRRG